MKLTPSPTLVCTMLTVFPFGSSRLFMACFEIIVGLAGIPDRCFHGNSANPTTLFEKGKLLGARGVTKFGEKPSANNCRMASWGRLFSHYWRGKFGLQDRLGFPR